MLNLIQLMIVVAIIGILGIGAIVVPVTIGALLQAAWAWVRPTSTPAPTPTAEAVAPAPVAAPVAPSPAPVRMDPWQEKIDAFYSREARQAQAAKSRPVAVFVPSPEPPPQRRFHRPLKAKSRNSA